MQQNKRSRGGLEGATSDEIDWQLRWKQDMMKVKTAWSTRYDALKQAHLEIKKQLHQCTTEARLSSESWKSALCKHIPELNSLENWTPMAVDDYLNNHPVRKSMASREPPEYLEEIGKLKALVAQKEEETCLLIAEVQRMAACKNTSNIENVKTTTNASEESVTKQLDLLQKRLANAQLDNNARMALLQSAILSLTGWEVVSHKIIADELCDSANSSPGECQMEKSRIYQMTLRPIYKSQEDPGDIFIHLDVSELAQQVRNKELRHFVENRLRATSLVTGSCNDGPWDISNTAHKQSLRFTGRLQTRWLSQRWRDVFASRKQIPSMLAVILLDEQLALMKLQGRVTSRDLKLREVLAEEVPS